MSGPPDADAHTEAEMAAQFERIIRRVKQSMNYRGSYSTRDILGSLVARWVSSGEWARLKLVPPADRKIGESVRRFILDRLDSLRRRGTRADINDDLLVLPGEPELTELVELAELRAWIEARVADLEAGMVDARVLIPLSHAAQVGSVLRLHLAGNTQRQIGDALAISLGAVNKRLAEGTNYLVVLQGLERGLGGPVLS